MEAIWTTSFKIRVKIEVRKLVFWVLLRRRVVSALLGICSLNVIKWDKTVFTAKRALNSFVTRLYQLSTALAGRSATWGALNKIFFTNWINILLQRSVMKWPSSQDMLGSTLEHVNRFFMSFFLSFFGCYCCFVLSVHLFSYIFFFLLVTVLPSSGIQPLLREVLRFTYF